MILMQMNKVNVKTKGLTLPGEGHKHPNFQSGSRELGAWGQGLGNRREKKKGKLGLGR